MKPLLLLGIVACVPPLCSPWVLSAVQCVSRGSRQRCTPVEDRLRCNPCTSFDHRSHGRLGLALSAQRKWTRALAAKAPGEAESGKATARASISDPADPDSLASPTTHAAASPSTTTLAPPTAPLASHFSASAVDALLHGPLASNFDRWRWMASALEDDVGRLAQAVRFVGWDELSVAVGLAMGYSTRACTCAPGIGSNGDSGGVLTPSSVLQSGDHTGKPTGAAANRAGAAEGGAHLADWSVGYSSGSAEGGAAAGGAEATTEPPSSHSAVVVTDAARMARSWCGKAVPAEWAALDSGAPPRLSPQSPVVRVQL